MKINPALDIDNDIENLATGNLCHASNVLVNATNDAILTENSIVEMFHLEDDEQIVGHISASDEFIVFTSANRILRVKEADKSVTNIQTNWHWQGGEVIGCYTYNVKDQMIIAISERRNFDEEQIPLKVINLDDPDYAPGATDNQYVIAPNIPYYNLTSFKFNGGTSIYKGMYTFFIRFKKGEDYTNWFPLGTPIQCSNQDYAFNSYVGYYGIKYRTDDVFGADTDSDAMYFCHRFSYSMSDYVDDKAEKVGYNIILTINLIVQEIAFEKYQVGYIVTTPSNETKTYTTADYNITANNVFIDCIDRDEVSVDELTANVINIYNAHTICAYGNRVYAGHYWEENPNINVPNIDVSGITVKAVEYDIFNQEEAVDTNSISLMSLDDEPQTRATVQPRVSSANEVTTDFDSIDLGYNYVVDMTFNYKESDDTVVPCNIKLHCNRINQDDSIIVGINDILRACYVSSRADVTNTLGMIDQSGNMVNIDGFLIYLESNNKYIIKPFIANGDIYPASNSSYGSHTAIESVVDPNNINNYTLYIGRTNPVSVTSGVHICDIEYKLSENVNNSDIIVNSITRFKSPNALRAIEPCWFYDMLYKQGDKEYETRGICAGNSSLEPYNNNILRTDGQYYYVGAHAFGLLTDRTIFMTTLRNMYSSDDYDYYFYEHVVDENNKAINKNEKYKFQVTNDNIVLGYAVDSGITLYYVKSDGNITQCINTIEIVERANPTNVITIDSLDVMNTVMYSRVGYTIDDLIDYYESDEQKYNWREDRTPTDNDFNPEVAYNGNFHVQGINVDNPYKFDFKIYNRTPTAVGFKNLTSNGDGTYDVDKDFVILLTLKEIIDRDNTLRGVWKAAIPNSNSQITIHYNNKTFSGYYNRFYFILTKSDTTVFDGENVYNSHLCYLREDSDINDPVPAFDLIYSFSDITGGGTLPNYNPYITIANFTAPVYCGANLYSELITNENIDTFTGLVFGAEYTKCAINYAVYNFYIHYILPDGNYTDGIKINNTATYNFNLPIAAGHSYQCDDTTTIGVIKAYCDENGITDNWDDTYRINTYFDIGDDVRICNIFPQFDSNGIALYINNNGDRFFRGSYDYKMGESIKAIKFEFDNIPEIAGYVGYFITYEKPEPILLGRGLVLGETAVEPYIPIYEETTEQTEPYANYPLDLQSSNYSAKFQSCRFYYPEFSIINSALGATQFIVEDQTIGGAVDRGDHLTHGWSVEAFETNPYSNSLVTGIIDSKIIIPNDPTDNGGKEGCLRLIFSEDEKQAIQLDQKVSLEDGWKWREGTPDAIKVYFEAGITVGMNYDKYRIYTSIQHNEFCTGIALKIRSNIYTTKNKELIPLGFNKYYDGTHSYGYEDFRYNYDYFYNNKVPIYTYNRYGCLYNEVDIIPHFFNQTNETRVDRAYRLRQPSNTYANPDPDGNPYTRAYTAENYIFKPEHRNGKAPIFRVVFSSFNSFDMHSVQVNQEPIENYYSIKDETGAQFHFPSQDVASVYTKYIYPAYVNDLYELPSCYNIYSDKLRTNYDPDNFANYLQFYGQTVRRSDVIADESIRNGWRFWRADNYKMISENKGLIYNVCGVGGYLIVHTEHSLFIFDRTNQLDAENKTVQTLMPDTFDIDYTEVFTSDKGYAGLQGFKHWTVCNYGYVFLDKDARKVYQWDNKELNEITQGMMNVFKFIDDIIIAVEELNNRFIIMCKLTLPEPNVLTISYSLPYKEWVSTHSYTFADMFNTKSNVYFVDKTGQNSICRFDESTYNNYINTIDDNTNFFKTEFIDGKPASYIDVITNNNGVDKVLDYISYRINKATDDQYSGDKLLIYTNCCYSDYKDVSIPRRRVDDWKNPVYRYGIWVVNWFRNWVKPIPTVHPIIRGNGKFDPNTGELKRQINNNALMVGKYWVVRLIFRDDTRRISIDDVQTY